MCNLHMFAWHASADKLSGVLQGEGWQPHSDTIPETVNQTGEACCWAACECMPVLERVASVAQVRLRQPHPARGAGAAPGGALSAVAVLQTRVGCKVYPKPLPLHALLHWGPGFGCSTDYQRVWKCVFSTLRPHSRRKTLCMQQVSRRPCGTRA